MAVSQSKRPLVSVVIPAYNHEKFIDAAMESVLQQTMDDLELIVVDDGSTDSTLARIQGYTDSRLRWYTQENQDAFNTINRGISISKGRFLAILNSDDIFEINRLERLLEAQKRSGAVCLFTDVIPISDTGEEFTDPDFGWNVWHSENRAFYKQAADLYRAFLHGNFMVTTSNLFMTRESGEKVGQFCSSRYFHDYDFILRMILCYPEGVEYLFEEKLLRYRIHSGNTLGEAAIRGRVEEQQMIRNYLQARLDPSTRNDADVGAARLIRLGEELHEVRTALMDDTQDIGVRRSAGLLARALNAWFRKHIVSGRDH